MPAKRKNTRKQTNSKKKATPASLNLVLKRLDKIDQHLETLEQNTTAEFKAVREEIAQGRRETTTEFKAVRGEMAQGFANSEERTAAEFKAVRGAMAQGFDSLRQEFKAELQKEFEKHGAGIHQHISRVENELKAETAELRREHSQLLTGMDVMAKNYEQFTRDRDILDAEHQDLKRDVENLKKRDMEKAAAIERIEKLIKAA
jgi:hypothetical protein